MKKTLFLLSFIVVLFATGKCLAQSSLQVSPSIVDQTISQNQDYKFDLTIFNSNLTMTEYTLSILPDQNPEFDLSNNISLNRDSLSIESNSSDHVEVYVKSAKLVTNKTYNLLINITEDGLRYQLAIPVIITIMGENQTNNNLINASSSSSNQLSGFNFSVNLDNDSFVKQDFRVINEFTDKSGNILASSSRNRTVLPKQSINLANNLIIDNGLLFFPKKLIANTTITDNIGNEKKISKPIIYYNLTNLVMLFLITAIFILFLIVYLNTNRRKVLTISLLYLSIMVSLYFVDSYFNSKSSLINADGFAVTHVVSVLPATDVTEDGENVYVSTNSLGYYLIYNNIYIERQGLVNRDKNIVPTGTSYTIQPFN